MKPKSKLVPILIVGAGPVGLCMALLLARLGVKSLVIERNSDFMGHPKARGVNTRTMEIFKQMGLDNELSKYELPKEARSITWLKTLQEEEISRVTMDDSFIDNYSSVQASFISQDNIERTLYNELLNYDNTAVLFSNELISFKEDESGVLAKIYDSNTNQEKFIHAKYLIGSDSAHSKVRKQLDIKMEGQENLGTFCSVYCEFDISRWTKHRLSFGYFFIDSNLRGKYLVTVDGIKKWIVVLAVRKSQNKELYTDEYCKTQIRHLLNIQDLHIDIISKGFWNMAAQIANQYKVGRTFLVGDSAHRMPPAGGFGMNTGIQDAHNLAWKLFMVLNKHIHESLLETYHEERYPIAKQNIIWSLENASYYSEIRAAIDSGDIKQMQLKLQEQSKNLNYIGLDLGFRYRSAAVLRESNIDLNHQILPPKYSPSTAPGFRAPYVKLIHGEVVISTLE
jgi:putative polyketide hydroxylase